MNFKDKVIGIFGKYLKPDMLEWARAIDKDKPVSSCIRTEKDYNDCIEAINTLHNKAIADKDKKIKELKEAIKKLLKATEILREGMLNNLD